MKRLFIFLIAFFGFMFVTDSATKAAEILNVTYEVTDREVTLHWESSAEKFEVYKDNELVWSGDENTYVQKGLNSDYNYSFVIVAFEKNKPVDMTEIKLTTEKSSETTYKSMSVLEEHPLENTKIDSVVTVDKVQLTLTGNIPDDDQKYEVYRNSEYIGILKGSEFIDKDIKPGETYNYKIVGKTEISEEQKEEIKKYAEENNLSLSKEEMQEMFQKPYEVHRIVKIPELDLNKNLEKMDEMASYNYSYTYVFRYKTFIPDCKVPAYSLVHGLAGYEFGGDCRGFSFDSEKYRTWVETPITFSNGSSSIDTTGRFIGWTYLYDSNGNLVESRRANPDGIQYSSISKSASKVSYHINHDVAIPFGLAPAINYQYDATVYSNGSFTITGSRDQAPSHEFYVYAPNTDLPILTLFQASNKGFSYLWPPAPSAEIKEVY
jgi:hypothetical protein